jgi:hypothetical protein
MDPISTLNQVMLLLRQQLAEKSQRQERAISGGPVIASNARPGASQQAPADNPDNAIRAPVDRLRAAGLTDQRLLFRAAVEGLLLREFGTAAGNDATFQQMGDWVCACLDEDPNCREMLRQLING